MCSKKMKQIRLSNLRLILGWNTWQWKWGKPLKHRSHFFELNWKKLFCIPFTRRFFYIWIYLFETCHIFYWHNHIEYHSLRRKSVCFRIFLPFRFNWSDHFWGSQKLNWCLLWGDYYLMTGAFQWFEKLRSRSREVVRGSCLTEIIRWQLPGGGYAIAHGNANASDFVETSTPRSE